jgi:hypothetical protein
VYQERLQELNKSVENGSKIKQLIESSIWQELVEPLFDRMITDILGGKENGRWVNGSIDKVEEVEAKLRYLQAYKAGIIAVHSAIYNIIDEGEEAWKLLTEYKEKEE